jgi:hypothetical protein
MEMPGFREIHINPSSPENLVIAMIHLAMADEIKSRRVFWDFMLHVLSVLSVLILTSA